MKTVVFICVMAVAVAVYTDIDENIPIDEMMLDPKKLKPYMDCYLDRGTCSKSAESYKRHIVEFLTNACKECDDKLKHIIEEFILNVLVKYPEEAELLKAKYDPTGANFPNLVYKVSQY